MINKIVHIFIILFGLVAGIEGQQQVTIDINVQYQTMYGFGASDAWSFDFVGKYWSDAVKNEIAKKLFSKEFDNNGNPLGIGLSRWRFNIGAGSAEQGDASNIEMEERRVECFLNEDSTYNWDKQEGQQWFLKQANEYGVEGLVAFLNSPPRFYTKSSRANSDNTSRGGPTNLKDDHYTLYADFITNVLKHFSDSGIYFAQVSPVNETQYEWNSGQEGCPWQNIEIKTLVEALNISILAKDLDTRILLADAGSYDDLHRVNGSAETSDQIWRFFNSENPEYLANNSQVLPGISGHSYWTDGDDTAIKTARQNISREAGEQGNIELYQTEYNLLSKSYNSKLANTIFLAKMIYSDLAIAGVSIWDYWTTMERERWSQLNRFYLIRLIPEGGDYADLRSGGSVSIDKNLWALGNFSRFIRPGYRRIKVTGANDLSGLMATGFVSPDTSQLILVYVNWSLETQSVSHYLDNLQNGNTFIDMVPYMTNSSFSLTKQSTISGDQEYLIPPRSVVTLVASLNSDNLKFTDLSNLPYQKSLILYPNPTQGTFTITNEHVASGKIIPIQLYNARGNLIYSDVFDGMEKNYEVLNGKPSGLYFLKTGNRAEKIVKLE